MQDTSITIDQRLSAMGDALVIALLIFGVATLLHWTISKNDPRKRTQGRPVRWYVTGLYLLGAIAGALVADNKRYYLHENVGGLGGFGILAGLILGNVHGWINTKRLPSLNVSVKDDSPLLMSEPTIAPSIQDTNPYSPPKQA